MSAQRRFRDKLKLQVWHGFWGVLSTEIDQHSLINSTGPSQFPSTTTRLKAVGLSGTSGGVNLFP